MRGGMSGESLLLKRYRLQRRVASATNAVQVGPCGSGWAPSQVMNSCRPAAALAAADHQCFVVGRRCASSAHGCAWSATMRMAAITSESVPSAQSGDDAGSTGVTLANFGMLMGSMVWGTGECKAMEGTYASESSDPHPSDTILDPVDQTSLRVAAQAYACPPMNCKQAICMSCSGYRPYQASATWT